MNYSVEFAFNFSPCDRAGNGDFSMPLLYESDDSRVWDSELQRWVYPSEVDDALNATLLAIDEYYNGNRQAAVHWMLKAHEANKTKASA
jgi:hypothetical protein